MAAVTMLSRVSGWVRSKALFWLLGASDLNDAFVVANRIPNVFRGLLAEGALHAAFVPSLSRVVGDSSEDRAGAQQLISGLLAVLLVVLALVVGGGILISPFLVRLFAEGFDLRPEKLDLTVLLTRLMFPYLGFISVAALYQGILNTHERFLLSASTPVFYNLVLAGTAWFVAGRVDSPERWLCAGVLLGGAIQAAVQWPAVHQLGYAVRPVLAGFRDASVHRVLRLMLPGIPALGISQINQLVSTRFASYSGPAAVSTLHGAYRITELMFGGLIVQLTTVLLPIMSRDLRSHPNRASRTLLDTIVLTSFVTLPTAVFLFILGTPVIGVALGGGRLGPDGVALMGEVLAAYAFSVVGLGQAKVFASAFFAHRETKVPMWCSLASLLVFTGGCAVFSPRFGAVAIAWSNTCAVAVYGLVLTIVYRLRHGFGGVPKSMVWTGCARQIAGCVALALLALQLQPWLVDVVSTSLSNLAKVLAAAALAGGGYVVVVSLLGGRELWSMLQALKGRMP